MPRYLQIENPASNRYTLRAHLSTIKKKLIDIKYNLCDPLSDFDWGFLRQGKYFLLKEVDIHKANCEYPKKSNRFEFK